MSMHSPQPAHSAVDTGMSADDGLSSRYGRLPFMCKSFFTAEYNFLRHSLPNCFADAMSFASGRPSAIGMFGRL